MSHSSVARDRTVVFVLNILIFLLSLCVTLNYFGALGAYHDENDKWKNDTFFGFEMNLTLTEDDVVGLIPLDNYADFTTDEIKEAINDSYFENGKFVIPTQIEEQEGEEKLHFAIPTSMLWDVNAQMLKQLIKEFNFNIDTTEYTAVLTSENIDKNVDTIVNTLTPLIEDVADLVANDLPVEDAKETLVGEFTEALKTSFSTLLPKELNDTLGETLKFFSALLLISTASWIYLMLKIICKFFMRNNAVKLKAPIIFGAIPGLLWTTPKFLALLASLIPDATLARIIPQATINLFTNTLSVSIFACGWFAFIAMLALVLFAIPYSASRKRLERRKLR